MFVQIIEGTAADPEGLRRQMDRWIAELQPGATGYLGSTGGIADDGRAVLVARFASADAARANSDRPEQGQWWAETEKCFDGPVSFVDSTDVESFLAGGSDDAGFVQIMKGTGIDRARMQVIDQLFVQHAPEFRPDLIGAIRAWTGPGNYVEVAYFTSEAAAREGEQRQPPAALAEHFEEFQELMAGVEFIDLPDPMLNSA
jgi:hypothetical protein